MLKPSLEKLVAQAKQRGLDKLSEEHVQSSYTLKVLEALGWNDGGWIINTSQQHTGKRVCNAAQLAAVDKQIDQLVYRLYGVSEQGIRLIEG